MKVKSKRRYNSSSRRAQAEALRERVLEVSRELFSKRGFDGVKIDDIAQRAGVASPTIYAAFKSKAGILKAIVSSTFFDAAYEALAKRIASERDPLELMRLTAAVSRGIYDRERAEIGILRGASAVSRDLQRVEKKFEQVRYDLQGARAELFVEKFSHAAKLGTDRVRDVMWMLTGRDHYRMLVLERGWSSDEYETWVASALIALITGTAPAPGSLTPIE